MAGTGTISLVVTITGLSSGTKTYTNTVTASAAVDSTTSPTLTHNAATSVTPPAGATYAILIFPSTASGPYNFGASALEPAWTVSQTVVLPLLDQDAFSIFNQHASVDAVVTIIWV